MARLAQSSEPVTFGSAGFGATSDMAANLLMHETKLKATVVRYQGSGPAIRDLTGGFIDAVIDQNRDPAASRPGRTVTALAISGPARVPQAPNLPTFAEADCQLSR